MARIPSLISLKRCYQDKPEQVRIHFSYLPSLIDDVNKFEIAVAYVFLKTEQAQNRTLYGGVVKMHRGNADLAKRVIDRQHLTRDGFKNIYSNVFGKALDKKIIDKLIVAEKVRDRIVHGKTVDNGQVRDAIADVLEYAEALNKEVSDIAGFKPFGSMQGFKGRAEPLDKGTTKWLMKGLGFGAKA